MLCHLRHLSSFLKKKKVYKVFLRKTAFTAIVLLDQPASSSFFLRVHSPLTTHPHSPPGERSFTHNRTPNSILHNIPCFFLPVERSKQGEEKRGSATPQPPNPINLIQNPKFKPKPVGPDEIRRNGQGKAWTIPRYPTYPAHLPYRPNGNVNDNVNDNDNDQTIKRSNDQTTKKR